MNVEMKWSPLMKCPCLSGLVKKKIKDLFIPFFFQHCFPSLPRFIVFFLFLLSGFCKKKKNKIKKKRHDWSSRTFFCAQCSHLGLQRCVFVWHCADSGQHRTSDFLLSGSIIWGFVCVCVLLLLLLLLVIPLPSPQTLRDFFLFLFSLSASLLSLSVIYTSFKKIPLVNFWTTVFVRVCPSVKLLVFLYAWREKFNFFHKTSV